MSKAYYTFTAKGETPGGVQVSCSGHVIGEDSRPDDKFPPHSVFEQARECVENQFPGLILDGDKTINGLPIKSYPTIRKNKTETKKLQT